MGERKRRNGGFVLDSWIFFRKRKKEKENRAQEFFDDGTRGNVIYLKLILCFYTFEFVEKHFLRVTLFYLLI